MHNCFHAADILLPRQVSMKKWACVACDQFSSQPQYWDRVTEFVGDAPSTLHMIFPEAFLRQGRGEDRLGSIHEVMDRYLAENLFQTYRRSFLYLERTMLDGSKRRGLVGQVDLEEYDFHPDSGAKIRATEGTVLDRLPLRMQMLRGAKLEFPHVIMLCDDQKDAIASAAREAKTEQVYDFDLMEGGGHITGWIISGMGVSLVNSAVSDYIAAVTVGQGKDAMAFAVGDGNHSLAAAIREISRPSGYPVTLVSRAGEETLYLSREESPLAHAILQPFLDRYVESHGGEMDYIHGDQVVRELSKAPGTLGIILPAMEKRALFPAVVQGGVLPRKTFSMGQAQEKRYYLEGKRRK